MSIVAVQDIPELVSDVENDLRVRGYEHVLLVPAMTD